MLSCLLKTATIDMHVVGRFGRVFVFERACVNKRGFETGKRRFGFLSSLTFNTLLGSLLNMSKSITHWSGS